ncbi:MAG: nicotinamide-nucleotide adenylyltransferase [Candidatus Thermoplasmatota archaeon]
MSSGALLGRFQPIHKGHLWVLRKLLSECDEAIVVIGSAQASHEPDNPFSAGERYEMVRACLSKEEMARVAIVPLEDLNRYPLWAAHVRSRCPSFQRVYTRNPLTAALFRDAGYEVVEHEHHRKELYSGTEVRRRMIAAEPWKELVPPGAVQVIERIRGEERVRRLAIRS